MLLDSLVNNEGIAYIAYKASGMDDIINKYSIQDFELLNPEFEGYLTRSADYIPDKIPVVLEIIGTELSPADQSRIDNAIWNHYLLKLSDNKLKIRNALIRTFWYILSTFASAILVFLANSGHYSDAVTMFLYLPIWYFAYRVLTYPIIDCVPIWKENRKLKQLAALKLKFSQEGPAELTHEECEDARHSYQQYYSHAESDTRHGKMIQKYMMDGDKVDLEIHVSGAEDIVRSSSVPGREFISEDLRYCFSQVEKFIGKNTPVELKVTGHLFTEPEQAAALRAFHNHSEILEKDSLAEISKNRKKIIIFTLFLILAAILLDVFGKTVDVAVHEIIVIFLWFFGDYLIEFVLIDSVEQHRSLRAIKSIRDMKITFDK